MQEGFLLSLGEWDTTNYSFLLWMLFAMGSLINSIVMMNLLIAVICSSFERIQEGAAIADNQGRIDLILEVYGFMKWNWSKTNRKYVQVCYEWSQ